MHLTGVNMAGVVFALAVAVAVASIIVAAPQSGCITHLLLAMVTHLGEEVGGEQRQGPVLATEAVVIRIEGKVVQIEEPASGKQTNLLVRGRARRSRGPSACQNHFKVNCWVSATSLHDRSFLLFYPPTDD